MTYDATFTYSKDQILIVLHRKRVAFSKGPATSGPPPPRLSTRKCRQNQSLKGFVLNNLTLEMCKILAHMNVSIVFKSFF
jgi:hypothetical protein